MNEHESTGHVSLKHDGMLVCDVMLRLSMFCGDRCCNELLATLRESMTYLQGLVSVYSSMKENEQCYERHCRENVKEKNFKLKRLHFPLAFL